MDSAGLGLIVSHYVRCQGKGVRLVAAGVSARVLQLFEMTTVDKFFPRVATVEEARSVVKALTPEELQHFVETAMRYGHWLGTPEEYAAVGFHCF